MAKRGFSRIFLPSVFASLVLFFLFAYPAGMAAAEDAALWAPLVARLAADGFDKTGMQTLFGPGGVEFDPRIMTRKVDSMVYGQFEPAPKPTARTLEKSAYRRFLTPWTLTWAARFMDENKEALETAERDYGPPREVITAILLVETKLGSYLGERNALDVLASMALCKDFSLIEKRLKSVKGSPERLAYAKKCASEKADWAYQELAALLRYAAFKGQDPRALPGSIYGAIGICQFMPTNALKFGVDADGDGRVDLFATRDAIHSVANYLRGHGWTPGITEDGKKSVIYAYNHSDLYVLAVLTVAGRLHDRRLGKKNS